MRRLWEHSRSGYLRVWLQSKLFPPPPRGTFPPMKLASVRAYPAALKTDERPHALLAVGGILSEDSLVSAYSKGIYPMCYEHPVRWLVFNPRMVLFLEKTRLKKGLRPLIRSGLYRVTFDTAFEDVVRACADRSWTWLVPERVDVSVALHRRGQAHSVEVWNADGKLAGGLFGVDMGRFFVTESAFSIESNTVKLAFAYLNCHLQHWGYVLNDGQSFSEHLRRLGFEEIPCKEYGRLVGELSCQDIRYGPWNVDEALDVAEWVPSSPGSQVK